MSTPREPITIFGMKLIPHGESGYTAREHGAELDAYLFEPAADGWTVRLLPEVAAIFGNRVITADSLEQVVLWSNHCFLPECGHAVQ
jgi:hypothetical protein